MYTQAMKDSISPLIIPKILIKSLEQKVELAIFTQYLLSETNQEQTSTINRTYQNIKQQTALSTQQIKKATHSAKTLGFLKTAPILNEMHIPRIQYQFNMDKLTQIIENYYTNQKEVK